MRQGSHLYNTWCTKGLEEKIIRAIISCNYLLGTVENEIILKTE